jgi:hypothetical protein
MATVVIDPGAIPNIEISIANFQDDTLGPLIVADAKRYAPHRTGNLAASIGHEVVGLTLYVFAMAPYAAWVELGHRVFHPSTGVTGPEVVVEEPFMRPALYKYRTPEMLEPPATFPVGIARPGGPTYPTVREYEQHVLGWGSGVGEGVGEQMYNPSEHYGFGAQGEGD